MNGFLSVLTAAALIGSGLNAGVQFAFSSFVMPGLKRIPAPAGIRAMQSINVMAVRPPFMSVFLGTTILAVGLLIASVVSWGADWAMWNAVGAVLFLAGTFVVTAAYHVPRNNLLADFDADSEMGAAYWRRYRAEWVRINHIRWMSGTLAAIAFLFSLTEFAL